MVKSAGGRFGVLGVLGIVVGLASSCIYDADQRCGAFMVFAETAYACVCENDAVPVEGGCVPCAADEVASGSVCTCAPGQAKNADNLCATVAGLGDPCDAATTCTDPTYSYCAVRTGDDGTCTKECSSNSDCDSVYTCATWEPEPYCRTFDGLGAACASSADCTGDANFCDTFMTHTCIVGGCSLTTSACPRDTMCCDFSMYGLGTLCAGACL